MHDLLNAIVCRVHLQRLVSNVLSAVLTHSCHRDVRVCVGLHKRGCSARKCFFSSTRLVQQTKSISLVQNRELAWHSACWQAFSLLVSTVVWRVVHKGSRTTSHRCMCTSDLGWQCRDLQGWPAKLPKSGQSVVPSVLQVATIIPPLHKFAPITFSWP